MSIRINGLLKSYKINSADRRKPVERTTRAEENKDIIAISSRAKDYQTAAKALRDTPDIREDKVMDLQNRIEAGKYNISNKEIAEKVVEQYINMSTLDY